MVLHAENRMFFVAHSLDSLIIEINLRDLYIRFTIKAFWID